MADPAIATPPAAPVTPAPAASTDPKNPPVTNNGAGPAAPAAPAPGKPPAGAEIESVKKDGDAPDPAKPYVVKVDGKEYRMSQEELIKHAGRGISADGRFQEAAKIRSEATEKVRMANELFQMLRDPASAKKILSNPKLGVDLRKIAEEFLSEIYQLEQMDPKDRELHDAKEKLRQAEEEKTKAAEERSRAQLKAMTEHYNQHYEKEVMAALVSSGLPKTRFTVQRFAYYMLEGLKQSVNLNAMDVVDLVREDFNKNLGEMLGSMGPEKLIEMMGDDKVKQVNEELLKRLGSRNPAPTPRAEKSSAPTKKLKPADWLKSLDEQFPAK